MSRLRERNRRSRAESRPPKSPSASVRVQQGRRGHVAQDNNPSRWRAALRIPSVMPAIIVAVGLVGLASTLSIVGMLAWGLPS